MEWVTFIHCALTFIFCVDWMYFIEEVSVLIQTVLNSYNRILKKFKCSKIKSIPTIEQQWVIWLMTSYFYNLLNKTLKCLLGIKLLCWKFLIYSKQNLTQLIIVLLTQQMSSNSYNYSFLAIITFVFSLMAFNCLRNEKSCYTLSSIYTHPHFCCIYNRKIQTRMKNGFFISNKKQSRSVTTSSKLSPKSALRWT